MQSLEVKFKKDTNIVSRQIEKEFLLVPIRRKIGDLDYIYSLNPMAKEIWQLIDGKRKLAEIIDILTKEYKQSALRIKKDISQFIKDLKEANLITD